MSYRAGKLSHKWKEKHNGEIWSRCTVKKDGEVWLLCDPCELDVSKEEKSDCRYPSE